MSQLADQWVQFAKTFELIPTLIAAMLTCMGGLTVFYSSRAQPREDDIAKISDAIKTSASKAQSAAMISIANNLPSGVTKEELRDVLKQEISQSNNISSEFDLEDRELIERLVIGYHKQALSQARAQFWFSVTAATIGFIYILFAAFSNKPDDFSGYFKILPGVVVDAIAALFFRQAEQTRQRATELYDRLRKDRQMSRAETVVNSIKDENIKSAVKAQIALHMVGLVPKEIDLQSFLSKNSKVGIDSLI